VNDGVSIAESARPQLRDRGLKDSPKSPRKAVPTTCDDLRGVFSRHLEAVMDLSNDLSAGLALNFEEWKVTLRRLCGRYNPEGVELKAFTGSVRPAHICGFDAVDLSCNAYRVERTYRDIRLDGTDHYGAIFQFAGRSTLIQNDQVTQLAVGDVAFVDSTLPVTYISENRPSRWLGVNLPRQSLISHLGSEPEAGLCRSGDTLAARLLFRLVLEAANECDLSLASAEPYMQLAIYDLLGALFSAPDLPSISPHSDKLFMRVCDNIKQRLADPDIGPCEVAAEMGISLRYLQKLFMVRGTTCSHFIHSLRLDHASRLIQRRASMKTRQPLSAIAYTCGFRDYNHFSRSFRRRFGHSPGTAGAQSAAN
jgi:AraC family transcriptional activator of tynA and feaB